MSIPVLTVEKKWSTHAKMASMRMCENILDIERIGLYSEHLHHLFSAGSTF
jgi:hypothetical protein